ncbi:MAG: DNA polymerase I [Bacteroidales bacterium]|nr:DNA polymerase I [Bacteroidales bacterium]
MTKKLFLLDAMALVYRAYYALAKTPRITSKGLNTSAILGFTNTLIEVLKKEKPTHIAVSFDTGAPTIRHADFAEYKANRESTPEDILASIPYIKQILSAFGIPIITMDGYEADDIIGTLAKNAELAGFQVYMMTSDKDYGQLVSDNIHMYKPAKFGQPSQILGPKEICEKYGIEKPEQLIDILGLWGDTADNIPGVPNVGEVKAKKLIEQFGSIEGIYERIDEVENAKLRQTLVENQEKALMSKMLATIILDVPVTYDFDEMQFDKGNISQLKEIFAELEFKALSMRTLNDPDLVKMEIPAGDLFHTTETTSSDLFSFFDTFDKFQHDFIEITNKNDILPKPTSATLFFDWMMLDDKITGFAFSWENAPIYYHFIQPDNTIYQKLLSVVFENEHTVVACNCKQNYKFFPALSIQPKSHFIDLQIAHYLLQPEQSHEIGRLSENYLKYSLLQFSKEKIFEKENVIKATCEKIEIYRKLFPIFWDELQKNNTLPLLQNIEMPLCEVLADMEMTGVTLDTKTLSDSSQQLGNELATLETKIYEYAGTTFNIASPKQLGEILFEKLKSVDNAKLTKTKQGQTGEEVLAKLIHRHPIVPLILEYRTLAKLKSTYIDALPSIINPKTGRIHTTFTQIVTSTGRLSSVNPNLQNIPIRTERGRDIRKAFVAENPDSVIMAADYSQIELRIVAAVCGDENMINSFKEGRDIHATTAAHIFNETPDTVTSDQRRIAKTVNFGILYGISAFGLADRLHISNKEASDLIHDYFQSFPKINEYLQQTMEFAKSNGYVETLLGRRRYIRDINSSNAIVRKAAERNATNAPIQGTAADLIKMAMIRIFNELKSKGLRTKMLLQVHDELVFEVPNEEIDLVKNIVTDKMENAMQLAVPLNVEIKWGHSWYEAH